MCASERLKRPRVNQLRSAHHWYKLVLLQTLVLGAVASASKVFMHGLSSLTVDNGAALEAALQRAPGRPLITVSNHVAVSRA